MGRVMEQSPLELYQKAYLLHYKERKVNEAVDIYQRLIKDFPDSNVSAYAVIQLQKIRANQASKELKHGRSGLSLPILLLFGLQFLFIAAAGSYYYYMVKPSQTHSEYQSALSLSVGKMAVGKDGEALEILMKLKTAATNDIVPYALSAEIYQKRYDFERAKAEYAEFQRAYPSDPSVAVMLEQNAEEERAYLKKMLQVQADSVVSVLNEAKRPQGTDEELKAESEAAPKPFRSAEKRKKPKLLLHPDSVTFF
jgi:tetratricopeptide (TPR) repeat protein